jgi:AraC-like DNA-binding protein
LNECDVRPLAWRSRLTYREYQPPARLADVVECFWRRKAWQPPPGELGVLPDGQVDLVWAANGEVRVMGPQQRALGRSFAADVLIVGVRFTPGVGPALLGMPAHELVDLHPSLAALDSRAASTLMRDLTAIEDPAAAPVAIMRAIQKRIHSSWSPDPVVMRASALLARPGVRVEAVATELALSRRQLERRFRDLVGYAPKTLQRILRFQSLLDALTAGEACGLAQIAPTLGYSDQPHLTRETRALSGLTPAQLESTLGAFVRAGAGGIFKTGTGRRARASTR